MQGDGSVLQERSDLSLPLPVTPGMAKVDQAGTRDKVSTELERK